MSVAPQAPPFQLSRIGLVMEPDLHDPSEAWGVLNPASARAPNGDLYLYPRVVAEGNYSRIGRCRVRFDSQGNPVAVDRLGYALEPQEPYERSERSVGGVEDPRITFIEPLGLWVMAYTALSHLGPRIALAYSQNLIDWTRLGLLRYGPSCEVDFNQYGNKDGMFFPNVVLDKHEKPALSIIHRPTYLVHHGDGTISLEVPEGVRDDRESMWLGYISLEDAQKDLSHLTYVYDNQLLATPEFPWENIKIGGGTPPIRIPEGWLTFYHGVTGTISLDPAVPKHVIYAAGAMVLDAQHPTRILYRSAQPVLEPDKHDERFGIVPNVVFPTAVDLREDGRIDVYYGMADSRIGAAQTTLPPHLPDSKADAPTP